MQKNKGFSYSQFVIFFLSVTLIAGLALNNYFRTIEQNLEREAILQLTAIRNALNDIQDQKGRYPNCYLPDAISINNMLNLQVPATDYLFYRYIPTSEEFLLEVVSARGWTLRYDSHQPALGIHCISKDCPTCQPSGENCQR